MNQSTVYFTNLRTKPSLNLLKKFEILIRRAGIESIDFSRKFTAIKIHFGEPGNLAYLRPNFARQLVKLLRKNDAIPFLTDCNTLYFGRRSNAPDHLTAAFENGYNPLTTDCPVIIADGLKGIEYREIKLDLEYCASAKIGSAIADADIIITMSHFKGHELTGFGGTLKNLGMGCASVGGKLFLHSGSSPEIYEKNCTGCKICEKFCNYGAIKVGKDKIAHIDYQICTGCGQCIAVCQYDAARVVWQNASEIVTRRIAEYAFAVVKDKPSFHVSFIMDVSPLCDCCDFNDYPIVPDIGIAASFDPVALDQACVDMVNAAPALKGSIIAEKADEKSLENQNKFLLANPNTRWEIGLEHAEKIGLGTRKYKIVEV
ncbi:MAG TPA: DUF362 domain-containing protein [Bacteroidales bacterium]|nr:DUF362 domain-containing protein [Bacteroidales bacterium]HQG52575.1 DUF362 domain-containing protein [Bacteroidales bacterium]HQJ20467.1 DUF362 domain-containing protein [Bacteroidales bacterium]